ncbi:hypothetical protein E2C01_051729 [Portunus trituberculatus]|uniref:Uncharacterized protein n=1 Tax=Portunus trituberculatus TaxID=210409 RepID=A0A5B7GFP1_PORTR|nr:hypothetical protein [Portunus trituberculatus]
MEDENSSSLTSLHLPSQLKGKKPTLSCFLLDSRGHYCTTERSVPINSQDLTFAFSFAIG